MKRYIPFILILLSAYISVKATVEVQTERLTTMNGLSNNSVRSIFQDSKGFIWLGTLNGLNRYDGNSFITFQPNSNQRISLSDHRIRKLTEDKNGFLWIATSAELFSCYDLKQDCFVDFTGSGEYMESYGYNTILSNDVWLWSRNNGCRRISYHNGIFSSESFNVAKGSLQSNTIRFIEETSNKAVWIGTAQGLYLWNNEKGLKLVEEKHSYQLICSINSNYFFVSSDGGVWTYKKNILEKVAIIPNIQSVQELTGEIVLDGKWIIFTSAGGYSFNPQKNNIERISSQLNIPNGEVIKDNRGNYWIHNKTGKICYVQTQTGEIKTMQLMPENNMAFINRENYAIVHDSHDIVWISTYGNGLFAYEPKADILHHYKSDSKHSNLIDSNYLLYVAEDRSGGIWVGSEYAGVSLLHIINEGAVRFYPKDKGINSEKSERIRMITSLHNGDISMANQNGDIYLYDSKLSIEKQKQEYPSNIYAICEDSLGIQWKASRQRGLFIGDKQYIRDEQDSTSLSSNELFCLLKDNKGRMWVGTFGGGLNLALPHKEKGYIFRHFFTKTYGQQRIRDLCQDQNGWIWAGTSEGLIIFDPEQLIENPDTYYIYNNSNELLSNEIRCILQDSRNRIWIAESGTGFSICTPSPRTDYSNLKFTHYGVKDGLVNNMVQAFVEDAEGMIWISTEYGISCFNTEKKTFENYFFSENIQGNVYSENSALKLSDGKLILGTNYGVIMINPKQIKRSNNEPVVTFTDLKINGISTTSDEQNSPLQGSIAYVENVKLRYDQNSFVVDFSTLDYSNSIPPKYSYKLQNYDAEWSIPSNLSFAAYKNLSPGTYYLHVIACNAAGVWGSKEAILEIIITPPFWKTKEAFLLYLLLVSALLFLIYRVIRNISKLRYKVKMEKQLTEFKLVFFTNISHEFRTPLTLIQGALEKMQNSREPKDINYALKVMDKSTQRMLRLINQLLEFRKMQNNKLGLSLEKIDVVSFLHEIYQSFKDAAQSKDIKYDFISSTTSCYLFVDKGHLDKIAYNLLSNAFKYTPSKGEIALEINMNDESKRLTIKVKDSGIGIPTEKQNDLFKRFTQNQFSENSMGIGLHLTYELVNVHKGNIYYEPNVKGGTVFIVELPVDSSIYEEKDFLLTDNALIQEKQYANNTLLYQEELKEEEENTIETIPLNKRRLLIIEDDNEIREFLVNELSPYFEVVAESDGTSGIERAYSYDADLIISDVLMPGYSGFEITQKLKNDFKTSHIPIILLTALHASENYLKGVESGADAYITKPFSTKLLLTRVFKLIEQRDKLREKFSNDLTIVRPMMCTNDQDKIFIDKLTHIIEKQLENPEFMVDDFASEMALGRTILYRKIRGITGYTPKEYLRVMRMKKAAELLITTTDTVAEVSVKVGINDPLYFSKCFKAQFGVPPSVYQKNGDTRR